TLGMNHESSSCAHRNGIPRVRPSAGYVKCLERAACVFETRHLSAAGVAVRAGIQCVCRLLESDRPTIARDINAVECNDNILSSIRWHHSSPVLAFAPSVQGLRTYYRLSDFAPTPPDSGPHNSCRPSRKWTGRSRPRC